MTALLRERRASTTRAAQPRRLVLAAGFGAMAAGTLLGALALAPLLTGTAPKSGASPFAWTKVVSEPELGRALTRRDPDRPVVIDFHANWCIDCRAVEKQVFQQSSVMRILADRFTAIRVDASRDEDGIFAIARRYGVLGLPAVRFLRADGSEDRAARIDGTFDRQRLTARLDGLLRFSAGKALSQCNGRSVQKENKRWPSAANRGGCGAGKPKQAALKKRLDPMQYHVTQEEGTEQPFQNAYWNNHREGIYVDVVSGEVLFSSRDKYDSGTGWPSFTRPVDKGNIVTRTDHKLGLPRTEVRSRGASSHLGHVFDDGPGPSGKRYCINSAALRFIPVEKMEAEGYGKYLVLFNRQPKKKEKARTMSRTETETATLAGGCFWGVEEIFRKLPGVIQTSVGYTGGKLANPTYEQVSTGHTGHAEAVQVVFDPQKLSYAELLRYFFRLHDPTTINQQGHDRGTQYRSAIFYAGENQHRIALQVKTEVDKSGKWPARVVTEIVPAATFWPAEAYHQHYLQKHPGGYTCHFLRD